MGRHGAAAAGRADGKRREPAVSRSQAPRAQDDGGQPQPHAPAVGPLLQFRDPRLEEQYWSQQLARRIRLMTHWAPHSDPALCAALLALHASLLLRLALGGAPGLERWPLPLAGAGLAWMQLRMGRRWPLGWVCMRSWMLAGAQLLLAAAVAASAGSVAAAALAPGSQPGALALQPSSAAQQALRVAARVAAAAAAAGGSCLHRLGQAVGFSDAGAFAAALVPIVLAVAAAKRWHVLLAGGALAALWTTGGLALLLARCRATLASSGLVALQSSGALDVLVAESTGFWVLAFAALPHLALQPLAVAVWVQLGTAALSIATCSSTCSAALLGRPWLQQRTIAAAEFLQQAAAAVPLPMPSRVRVPGRCRAGPGSAACPAAWSSSGTPSPDLEAAALGACCALKSFAWLACCCILSLGLLHWRELEGRLLWARRQRWAADQLTQDLRWRRVPLWAAAAEAALACGLAWHASALLFLHA